MKFQRLGNNRLYLYCQAIREYPEVSALTDAASILADDELRRCEGYIGKEKKAEFILARSTLRRMLSHYLGIRPAEISIDANTYGKPFLRREQQILRRGSLHFNISHTAGLLLWGVALNSEVGVDAQVVRPLRGDAALIAERFFSREEQERFRGCEHNERLDEFYRIWCRKEAYLKCRGTGFSLPAGDGTPPEAMSTYASATLRHGTNHFIAAVATSTAGQSMRWERIHEGKNETVYCLTPDRPPGDRPRRSRLKTAA